jgi:hypothetical protein
LAEVRRDVRELIAFLQARLEKRPSAVQAEAQPRLDPDE